MLLAGGLLTQEEAIEARRVMLQWAKIVFKRICVPPAKSII